MSKQNIFSKIVLPGVILFTAIFCVNGQSKKDISESQKKISSEPAADSKKSTPGSGSKSDSASQDDKYKLIFPVFYEGGIGKGFENPRPNITTDREMVSVFEELNRVGAEGYRFVAANNNYSAVVVKLDEGRYEYRSIITSSRNLYEKIGFSKNHELLAGQKFQFINNSMTFGYCLNVAVEDPEDCHYEDLFLYEKENNGKLSPPMSGFVSIGGFRQSPEAEMEAEIKEKMANGFLPVAAFSIYEIWLRKTADPDALRADVPEIKAVRSVRSRQHLSGKINDLARQGFRLGIITSGLAIMYRHQKETATAAYVWLGARKKNFEKDLAELAALGAIYRATYPNNFGEKETLVFEVPQAAPVKKREYKVLRFDFTAKPNGDGTLRRVLTPESEENLKTLNQLARENFIVCDVFYTGKVSLLLEREIR